MAQAPHIMLENVGDTRRLAGRVRREVFGIYAALAEFERELISERTVAGLASARAPDKSEPCLPSMDPNR